MQNEWRLRPIDDPSVVRRIQKDLNDLPEPLARALVIRGIDTFDKARDFFRPNVADLHDPFLMRDMDRAADRLAAAIDGGERVLVYGDYDVDGTTAAALMVRFLRDQGMDVSYFIPDRYRDGYGLGERGIEKAAERGADLIVALDCGITAHDMAEYAREKGLDLIICDHHTPGETVPDAVAVLDPKRDDCAYPFKELSGCGVGFKLAQAVLARRGQPPERAFSYLDLLALSIASDIVPIGGENRILMRQSLEVMRENPYPGVEALARVANVDLDTCSSSSIVFRLGPRINAAGRMGSAERAVDLLLADDRQTAGRLAEELNDLNDDRRLLDRKIRTEAVSQAREFMAEHDSKALVLFGREWHPGIVGIVASRIVEEFYRPTVMLCEVDGVVRGSARSVDGFNIYEALSSCSSHLARFGGHDYAAGMTLEEGSLAAFRDQLNQVVADTITDEQLTPKVEIDAELNLDEIGGLSSRFWKVLRQFGPFGPTNQRPVFVANRLQAGGQPRTVGSEDKHLKFSVRTAGKPLPAIGFNMGEHLRTVGLSLNGGRPFDLVFTLEENHWNGNSELQLNARDIRKSDR